MSETEAMQNRIDQLEIAVADQDKTIEELSSALTEQYKQIEALKHQLAHLGAQVEDISAHPALADAPEPPPPHY